MADERLITRLRLRTAEEHALTENSVDIAARLTTPARYIAWVGRLWGMHAAAEPAVEAFLGRPRVAYSDLLLEDLDALGGSGSWELASRPLVPSADFALGVRYVMEGSALGGLQLARLASRILGVSPNARRRLHAADTPAVVARWRDVRREISETCRDEAALTEGARLTFAATRCWLCADPASSPSLSPAHEALALS